MLISKNSINTLIGKLENSEELFCSGLFLSARWFTVSQLDYEGLQVIIMPDKDSAEYCTADLYNLIEGDRVFFLPDSGKSLERSNYKSSLGVQRTSAIGKILEYDEGNLYIVTYPSALEEEIPSVEKINESVQGWYLEKEAALDVAEKDYYTALAEYDAMKSGKDKATSDLNYATKIYGEESSQYNAALKKYKTSSKSLFGADVNLGIARDKFSFANQAAHKAFLTSRLS